MKVDETSIAFLYCFSLRSIFLALREDMHMQCTPQQVKKRSWMLLKKNWRIFRLHLPFA